MSAPDECPACVVHDFAIADNIPAGTPVCIRGPGCTARNKLIADVLRDTAPALERMHAAAAAAARAARIEAAREAVLEAVIEWRGI